MDDTHKTTAQLIAELNELRRRVAQLEVSATEHRPIETQRDELFTRLQRVLDSVPLGCIIIDPDWRISYWNTAAEEIFGFTRAEALGRLHYEVTVPASAREYVSDILARTAQGNLTTFGENENITKAGRSIVCEWHNTPLRDAAGRYVGTLVMAQDITARKQVEQALRKSQTDLSEAQRIAGLGSWEWDVTKDHVTWSKGLYALALLDENLPAPTYAEHPRFYTPESMARLAAAVECALQTSTPYELDLEMVRTDGSKIWLTARGEAVYDAQHQLIGLRGTVVDISARRHAEEELEHFFDLIPDMACLATTDGYFKKLNKEWERVLGYSQSELLAKPFISFIHPDDRAATLAEVNRQISEQATFNFTNRYRAKDGTYRWFEWNATPSPDGTLLVAAARDITARKQAEDALRESEERFRTLSQLAPVGIYLTDKAGQCHYANELWLETAGLTLAEALGDGWIKGLHPEDRSVVLAEWQKMTQSHGKWGLEYRFQTAAGKITWVFGLATELNNDLGETVGYIGVNTDITNRKEAEEALRASEERYRSVIQTAMDGFWLADLQGHILQVNETYCQMSGYSQQELLTMNISDVDVAETAAETAAHLQQLVSQGQDRFTTRHRRKDGRVYDVEISAQYRAAGEGQSVAFLRDITDRQQAEGALRESEKRFRDIFENVPIGMFQSTPEGKFIYANPAISSMFGYDSPDELIQIVNRSSIAEALYEDPSRRPVLVEQVEQAGGNWKTFETRYRRKDSRIIDTLLSFGERLEPVSGQQFLYGFVQDVTDRKQAENLLRKSEEKFSTIFKTSPESITIASMEDGTYLEVNEVFLKKTGFQRSEVIGHTSTDLGVWIDTSDRQQFIEELSKNGFLRNFKTRYRMRSGEIRFFEISSEIIQLEGLPCSLNFITDITERKRAEETLQVALTKYKTLFEVFPLGITVSDQAGQVTETNATAGKLLGISEEEHAQRQIDGAEWQIIRSDGSPMPAEEFASVRALKENRLAENVEMGLLKPDGSITWLNVTASPLPLKDGGVVITYNDLTERKRMEEALRESEAKYRNLFENMNDAFALHKIVLDESGRPIDYQFLDVNPVFAKRVGMKPEELINRRTLELFPETEPAWIEAFGEVALTGQSLQFTHYSVELDKYFETRIYCPRLGYFAALFTDITDRKRAEEALRQATERLELAQDSAGVGVWDWNVVTGAIEWTPQMFRLFGLEARQAPASFETWQRVVHPEDLEITERRITQALQNHINLENEYRIVWPDGQEHWISASGKGIYDEHGQALRMLGICVEITARKRAEEQLLRAQKLESLGVLAGGVAHDFNNLLVALLGQTSLAAAKLPPDHPAQRHLERAVIAARRAADLTRQMLAYSGRGAFQMTPLNLNTLIRDNVDLFESSIAKSIKLRADLAETLPLISADAGQMQQIIMNLVLNAAEATGERGGAVSLATSVIDITASDGRWAHYTGQAIPAGRYVQLRVQDTGHGMSAETLGRIFDPFFTTKFTGRGLGLAAVLGIVRGHQGGLWVESEVGRGTIFTLIFPVTEEAAAPGTTSRSVPTQQRVLVIDDEEPVLEAIADMLELDNVPALCAATGAEGVALFRERHADIGLVLLDLSMPGLNGRETFDELKRIDPKAHIVLTSGYTQTEATRGFEGRGLAGFLHKPYDLETLLSMVRQHLKRAAAE